MRVRTQARYTAWRGFSHNLRTHTGLLAYYNFEDQNPDDLFLKNQSLFKLASFRDAKFWNYDQPATENTGPEWTDGRWEGTGKGALWFDGATTYAATDHNKVGLDLNEAVTMFVWVRFDGPANFPFLIALYGAPKPTASQPDEIMKLGTAQPAPPFYADMRINNSFLQPAQGVFNAGEWVFYAGVWDGLEMRIYINGELLASKPYSQDTYLAHGGRILIGADQDTGSLNQFLYGVIDECAIFNVALSEQEVRDIYRMGKP
jgi:hypothetical protein